MADAPLQIPDKPYFKIGEVCRLTDTQPYVLRFWESEFPSLEPQKTRSGQRLYRREDIELVLTIKRLLYEESYTIAGARKRLESADSGEPLPPPRVVAAPVAEEVAASAAEEKLEAVRKELRALLELMGPGDEPSP